MAAVDTAGRRGQADDQSGARARMKAKHTDLVSQACEAAARAAAADTSGSYDSGRGAGRQRVASAPVPVPATPASTPAGGSLVASVDGEAAAGAWPAGASSLPRIQETSGLCEPPPTPAGSYSTAHQQSAQCSAALFARSQPATPPPTPLASRDGAESAAPPAASGAGAARAWRGLQHGLPPRSGGCGGGGSPSGGPGGGLEGAAPAAPASDSGSDGAGAGAGARVLTAQLSLEPPPVPRTAPECAAAEPRPNRSVTELPPGAARSSCFDSDGPVGAPALASSSHNMCGGNLTGDAPSLLARSGSGGRRGGGPRPRWPFACCAAPAVRHEGGGDDIFRDL